MGWARDRSGLAPLGHLQPLCQSGQSDAEPAAACVLCLLPAARRLLPPLPPPAASIECQLCETCSLVSSVENLLFSYRLHRGHCYHFPIMLSSRRVGWRFANGTQVRNTVVRSAGVFSRRRVNFPGLGNVEVACR